MSDFEKDDIHMLSDANRQQLDEHVDSQFHKFPYSRRFASFSVPLTSRENNESEVVLVGRTGPLRREKRTPFIQMSGPLYVKHKYGNLFVPNQAATGCKPVESLAGNFPSLEENDQDYWAHDSYTRKNEHLLRSGQLGMCNAPYCTICPTFHNFDTDQQKNSKASSAFDPKFHNALYGGAKGRAGRFWSSLQQHIPGVMNPHARVIQQWTKFFVISCLVATFVDPLFFFLLSVLKEHKCIVINRTMTTTIMFLRSLTDLVYFLHMLLQFRLAYVAPESRVVGAGELVDHPKKIALNYIRGFFFVDLFVILPLPQIIILLILPRSMASSGLNYTKNLLQAAVLAQYIPRLYRFLPLHAGQSPSGFVFESAWANFVINLLTFMLSGHVVGSCWYLFGLQRVNQCLRNACRETGNLSCMKFIDCGYVPDVGAFPSNRNRTSWGNNGNASACFDENKSFYGIYDQAVNLTTEASIVTRYIYSVFWGFQQISTLAGNLVPSYYVWEVIFTTGIIGLGLLLFALLIGNMQNFLQALGRRRLEMTLRRRDVEQWMSHRRLPEDLRGQVREAERYNWAATRGVNEEMLLENLPEDLQRNIKNHLCKFVKKVRIFALMDQPVLDAICEKLRQKIYIKGSKILYEGGLIDKMVFIIRGKTESRSEAEVITLCEGDVCGEELLTLCLEQSAITRDGRKMRIPGRRLLSNRKVTCLTNVEAFSLRAADLEEVTSLFARLLRNPRVQSAIRYESPYWRSRAAQLIQVAWRYRKKHLNRADTSQSK